MDPSANNHIKIYLVSDAMKFALTDVFHGYANALKDLGIPHECFPYHLFRDVLADPIAYHVIHSTALMESKKFTHVMFIGGLNVPDFILESLHGIKSIVVSTEDPHSFDPMKNRIDKISYYFTNERSIARSSRWPNIHYCPTAACVHECGKLHPDSIEDKYRSDILFLGALYPNRRRILEEALPYIESQKLRLKICGHIAYMPKSDPLSKYVFDARTIPHVETVKYYNGAKAVVNILRDVHWNPRTKSKKNPYNRSRFAAESLNPRAYEVPLCGSLMLLDETRSEAREVFTDKEVAFFSDAPNLVEAIRKHVVEADPEHVEDMKQAAYMKVLQSHTYLHRMKHILEVIAP